MSLQTQRHQFGIVWRRFGVFLVSIFLGAFWRGVCFLSHGVGLAFGF